MNVAELKAILEDLPDDTEVKFAHQPSYPLECSISMNTALVSIDQDEITDVEERIESLEGSTESADVEELHRLHDRLAELRDRGSGEQVLYLAEGGGGGYLGTAVCNELGWGR